MLRTFLMPVIPRPLNYKLQTTALYHIALFFSNRNFFAESPYGNFFGRLARTMPTRRFSDIIRVMASRRVAGSICFRRHNVKPRHRVLEKELLI
jgi:hypothetical protein